MGQNKAFSLIELSIVLIILGVLITGVIGGASLINSSKLSRTATEISEYNTISKAFQVKFQQLPGDFDQATEVLDSAAENGDGDSFIGTNSKISSYSNSESMGFFNHLFLAKVLPTKYTAKLTNISDIILNKDIYPLSDAIKSSFYYIRSDDFGGKLERTNRITLGTLDEDLIPNVKMLYNFDKKFDDGKPLTGKIIITDFVN